MLEGIGPTFGYSRHGLQEVGLELEHLNIVVRRRITENSDLEYVVLTIF